MTSKKNSVIDRSLRLADLIRQLRLELLSAGADTSRVTDLEDYAYLLHMELKAIRNEVKGFDEFIIKQENR